MGVSVVERVRELSHYLIAEIEITDRAGYANYEAGFADVFMKFEGKMLSVDEQPTVLEGEWACTRTVLIEFPNEEAALAWYRSDEYQALARHRFAASTANVIMVKGR